MTADVKITIKDSEAIERVTDGCDVQDVTLDGAFQAFMGCLMAWEWKQKGVDMTPVLWRAS